MNSTLVRVPGRHLVLTLLAVLSCAGSRDGSTPATMPAGGEFTPRERPRGPAADMSAPVGGVDGAVIGAATASGEPAYLGQEYVASGAAAGYRAGGTLSDDGRWTFEASSTADYRTRVIVRRPERAADCSGTV